MTGIGFYVNFGRFVFPTDPVFEPRRRRFAARIGPARKISAPSLQPITGTSVARWPLNNHILTDSTARAKVPGRLSHAVPQMVSGCR